MQKETQYLGFIISEDDIMADNETNAAITGGLFEISL